MTKRKTSEEANDGQQTTTQHTTIRTQLKMVMKGLGKSRKFLQLNYLVINHEQGKDGI